MIYIELLSLPRICVHFRLITFVLLYSNLFSNIHQKVTNLQQVLLKEHLMKKHLHHIATCNMHTNVPKSTLVGISQRSMKVVILIALCAILPEISGHG